MPDISMFVIIVWLYVFHELFQDVDSLVELFARALGIDVYRQRRFTRYEPTRTNDVRIFLRYFGISSLTPVFMLNYSKTSTLAYF